MDGIVAYVAPNDVRNNEDSAYDRFFASVGTERVPRPSSTPSQREALVRREQLDDEFRQWAADNG